MARVYNLPGISQKSIKFSIISVLLVTTSVYGQNDPLCAGLPSDEEFYFPSPLACNHYYKCLNGVFSEEICPQGLYFSQNNNGCVEPQYAECLGGSGSPPPPTDETVPTVPITTTARTTISTTPNIVDTIPPSTTTEPPTTTTTTTAPLTTTPEPTTTTFEPVVTTPSNTDPRCEGNITSYWPHPSECRLYIECYHGYSYEMACPDKKYFSDHEKRCVEKEESECCEQHPSKC